MTAFSIKIVDENIVESYEIPCCVGEIQIGEFKETFEMPLEYWTMEGNQLQWRAGLERIKTYDKSCLVAEIQDPKKAPHVNLWVLYRDTLANKIYIQNHLFFGKRFTKVLKGQSFNLDTCYSFIIPRKTESGGEFKVSEWEVELKDFIAAKI